MLEPVVCIALEVGILDLQTVVQYSAAEWNIAISGIILL